MESIITKFCGRCLEEPEIINSHLIAKGFHKQIRDGQHEEPDPKILRDGMPPFSHSRHVTQYFLCRECDNEFARRGENWVIANSLFLRGGFKLRDSCYAAPKVIQGSAQDLVATLEADGIERETLIYFAGSVFWRAAATSWNGPGGKVERLSFGNQIQERFRAYLLEERSTFPEEALLHVAVAARGQKAHSILIPVLQHRAANYSIYRFDVPGIRFQLVLGESVPADLKRLCFVKTGLIQIDKQFEKLQTPQEIENRVKW